MGAWGEGLQSNDTAMDYIGDVEDGNSSIDKAFQEATKDDEPQATLGLTEWLLDKADDESTVLETKIVIWGLPVRIKILAEVAINVELKCLDSWRHAEDRETILLEFRKRIKGEDYDKELFDKANRGLFQRMAESTNSDTEEDDEPD